MSEYMTESEAWAPPGSHQVIIKFKVSTPRPHKINPPEPINKNLAQLITSTRGPLYQIW